MVIRTADPREFLMLKLLHLARTLRLSNLVSYRGASHNFNEYFKGMEKTDAVKRIFGDKTEETLRNLRVEFAWFDGYMWVNNTDGHLVISSRYLENGDRTDIYLDLIHELVHVRQFMEGKELFDERYNYVERPTEVEAYCITVEEARRLGLSDKRICQYLKTEWMSTEDLKRLAKTLNVKCTN